MKEIIKKILFSKEEIEQRCKELGEQISKDYEGKCPIFIGLLKGSIPFFAELTKNVSIDCSFDFMDASSYSGTESTGHVRILKDLDYPITDRDVIIVEDIIDSGLTLKTIIDLLKVRKPASLEIACLLDKEVERKEEIDVKYTGFKIKNEFVVGFGLDYEQLYRNLPYIGIVDVTKL